MLVAEYCTFRMPKASIPSLRVHNATAMKATAWPSLPLGFVEVPRHGRQPD